MSETPSRNRARRPSVRTRWACAAPSAASARGIPGLVRVALGVRGRMDLKVGVQQAAQLVLVPWAQVAVAIERDRHGRVTQRRGNCLGVRSGCDCVARERVPGLVEPERRQLCRLPGAGGLGTRPSRTQRAGWRRGRRRARRLRLSGRAGGRPRGVRPVGAQLRRRRRFARASSGSPEAAAPSSGSSALRRARRPPGRRCEAASGRSGPWRATAPRAAGRARRRTGPAALARRAGRSLNRGRRRDATTAR